MLIMTLSYTQRTNDTSLVTSYVGLERPFTRHDLIVDPFLV